MQLYLDVDGVVANFDKHGTEILGLLPRLYKEKYGEQEMWDTIKSRDPDFWLNLELMPDAMYLYDHVKHLNPIFLTGIPRELEESRNNQKFTWIEKYFGKEQAEKTICCRVSKKATYCNPGDILVDDRVISQRKWEKARGIFILHKSSFESLVSLYNRGVDIKEEFFDFDD